jgi:P-type conjugative transfer protein TrbJ
MAQSIGTPGFFGGSGGGGGIGKALGSVFSGGKGATEITQLANNAQLLLMKANQLAQIQNQLEMLAGLDLNDAATFAGVTWQAQSLLGQLDGILYDVSGVAGMIEERYPHAYPRGATLEQLIGHTEGWRDVERNAVTESHQLQSRIAEAMIGAAERDKAILETSMAAPGIRSAIQAGNQLTGSLLSEVRNLQLATLTHARAVETQVLKETGKQAQRQAIACEFYKDTPGVPMKGCE